MLSVLVIAVGLFATLLLGYFAVAGPSAGGAAAKRLETVRERFSKSTEVAAAAQMRRIYAQRQTKVDGFAQRLIPRPALLRARLQQTGRNWSLGQYAMVSAGLSVVAISLCLFRGMPAMLAVSFGMLVGIGLPHWMVSKMIARRIAKFNSKFPDAIDLMVRGLRSGLPISETIGVVASEIPGPVSEEFRTVSDKMKIGRTMEAALQDTSDRLNVPEFQFFVIALAIQRETGGNLAETLANLSDVLRKRAAMKLKIRAMSSESKASAWIVGALPFIVFGLIWFINGAYMQNFFVDQRLMIAGGVGLVWMGIGAWIMSRMVNFEI
ncbi:MAG: type II secretion system F family protein [Sphingosinicella sp.]